ncbi:ubiquinone biosynthesis protein COQ4 [Solitalea sp. MAHUQ-68]|uniref:Ubiquinone biosynthesis protein COQ4 n=1 Tax=Solitalea agri TaxID=2953739 RepID=A0A9X2FD74_9SPHI|nr:ubiquinone biosynthesis protein COQ4 [Solitalea agri]MCO4294703.1 ubiquinone biosynthesis protein COQ4 [Solitalea agri]
MRKFIIIGLYNLSKKPYQALFKNNKAWNISPQQLLDFPEGSLGNELGCFLTKNDFELQAKLENHDVFHVLSGIGTSVIEEIALQYYLLGNGKKSIYLKSVILLGTLFYPNQFSLFFSRYKEGRSFSAFHNLDFFPLLHCPIAEIKKHLPITALKYTNKDNLFSPLKPIAITVQR